MFHALMCSKREKSRGPTEKRPGRTTPRMGTAEKAALSRGVRGDRGPTRCSMSRWLNVVDGVKGSSGRGDMSLARKSSCFRNSSLGMATADQPGTGDWSEITFCEQGS